MADVYIGIDPGIHHTGLAVITARSVVLSQVITAKHDPSIDETLDVHRRSELIAERILDTVGALYATGDNPRAIAVETFTDQGGARKQFAGRWKTPYLIGYLARTLEVDLRECRLVFQSNNCIRSEALAIALKQLKDYEKLHERKSDHMHDAALHALYLCNFLKE